MKKVSVFLFLFVVFFGYAQAPVLEPGVYKSSTRGQQLMLKVYEDNQYEMAVLFGKYTVTNDTIVFRNSGPGETAFKLKINKDAAFSSTFKIKFETENIAYSAENIYIGTQKEDHTAIEYKSLEDYVKKIVNRSDFSRKKDFTIDVEKTKYLYLVERNRKGAAMVSKFAMDPNANEIEVKYDGVSFNGIELRGVIDPETKKLSVVEGRRQSPVFDFEKVGTPKMATDEVSPLQVVEESDWLKNNGFAKEAEFDSSYLERRNQSQYNFKLPVLKTYAEALKSVEKTPEKFLVVFFDDGKKRQTDFNQFIKKNELRLSRSMREKYNPEKDHFNYYLATEKDKALLETHKIKDKSGLLILNSNGALVYHTKGGIEQNSNLFELYYSVYDEVKRANALLKLDQLVKNKKTGISDFKKAFGEIVKTKKSYDHYSEDLVDTTAVEMVDSTAVEVVEDYAAAADTVAVAYEEEEDEANYYHVEDPENLYSIKTNKEVITEKWEQIVAFYTKQEAYDEEFVKICKKELLHKGFMYKLYGGPKFITDTDFKILDYLFKHYSEILETERKQREGDEEEYGYSGTEKILQKVLSSFFETPHAESVPISKAHQLKLVDYYKTFLKISGFNLNDFKNYLAKIAEAYPNDYGVYFKEYDEFFQRVATKNTSLIETLDEIYTAQKNSYQSWRDFKQTYARLANNVAWLVVESKSKETTTIQKAIQWSETSLKIDKNNYRYLDTLGQLYYKNQEKEKAIATEQKAIDNIPATEKTTKEEYLEVLQQMKNGTY